LAALLLSACSDTTTTADKGPAPQSRPGANAPRPRDTGQQDPQTTPQDQSADTSNFIRFVDEGDGEGRLDTAIVTYVGPKRQRVDLVAAVHVADRVYYERLQKDFAAYDALLYEMVKPKDVQPEFKNKQRQGLLSYFQRQLKNTLDLEFQLDGIDYMQPNFVHADLDVQTFRKLSKDRGESIVALLLKTMAEHQRQQRKAKNKDGGESDKAVPPLNIFHLIAAFMSKDSSRMLKHLFARQLHGVEKALAGLNEGHDGKGSVILTERNKKCMEVLKERLEKGDKRLGIFYGGAHMPDLETRLRAELGFKKLEQRWLTAWDIKKKDAPERVKKPSTKSRPGK
jgi:hypothetical protein